MADCQRLEVRGQGVAVVLVQPGNVHSNLHATNIAQVNRDSAAAEAAGAHSYAPLYPQHLTNILTALANGAFPGVPAARVGHKVGLAMQTVFPEQRYGVGFDLYAAKVLFSYWHWWQHNVFVVGFPFMGLAPMWLCVASPSPSCFSAYTLQRAFRPAARPHPSLTPPQFRLVGFFTTKFEKLL